MTSIGGKLALGAGAVCVLAAAVTVPLEVAGAAPGPASPGCGSGKPRLTVEGTGTATGTPDRLTLDLGVSVSGADAHDALAADDATTRAVLAALKAGGVADQDVQTTGLSLQPRYAQTGTLTGYSVTDTVVAKLQDFSAAGSVIDDAVAAGGNAARIDGLSFSVADPRPLEDQARHDAVRQAASHAASMAAAAGERLGPVCSVTDHATTPSPLPVRGAFGTAAASSPAAVPLQPGTQQATARVTLVYALAGRHPAS